MYSQVEQVKEIKDMVFSDRTLHVNWPDVAQSNVILKQMQNLKEKEPIIQDSKT